MPNSRRTPAARLDPRGPLVLDARTLPRRPGSARTLTRTVPAPADLHTGLAGIPEGSDLRLDVTLESVTEGVLATVTAVAPVTGECARCLEPVAQTIEVRCHAPSAGRCSPRRARNTGMRVPLTPDGRGCGNG